MSAMASSTVSMRPASTSTRSSSTVSIGTLLSRAPAARARHGSCWQATRAANAGYAVPPSGTDGGGCPLPASTALSEAVLEQRRLLERLLVRGRRGTGEEPSLRSPDARDAEFVKNLQIFLRLVVDADALHLRAAHGLTGDPGQAAAVNGRLEELRERITLPTDVPLTLELLLGRRFELERLLIEL